MLISFGRTVKGLHLVWRAFKAHAFPTTWTLNFKATWNSNNWSSTRFISAYSSTRLFHILFEKSFWSITSFLAAHSRVVIAFTGQTVTPFALPTTEPTTFNEIYLRASSSIAESIFLWPCVNEMINRNLNDLLPVIIGGETVEITDKNILQAFWASDWVHWKVLYYNSNRWLNAVKTKFVTAGLQFEGMRVLWAAETTIILPLIFWNCFGFHLLYNFADLVFGLFDYCDFAMYDHALSNFLKFNFDFWEPTVFFFDFLDVFRDISVGIVVKGDRASERLNQLGIYFFFNHADDLFPRQNFNFFVHELECKFA